MGREKTGSIKVRDGKIYARITYIDESGKRHELMRRAENRTHAKQIIKQLINELENHGEKTIQTDKMTFAELASHYSEKYLIPAKYVNDRKVAGLRSVTHIKAFLPPLISYFGRKRIRNITHADLLHYKLKRLETPTVRGSQRAIASVNRELELIRRMLGIAYQEGWIIRNPFSMGESLISKADEKKRERILSRDEEIKLLEVCTGKREHLKPIIICALDTGMRQGEIFSLKWQNIDFSEEIITIEAFNTKTMQERQVSITYRLKDELLALHKKSTGNQEALVFGINSNVKRSFDGARKDAGLPDVRFHDLRHTAATRLVQGKLPLSEVSRILGHTQANTTYRYVNANVETARRAAMTLNDFHQETEEKRQKETIN